MKTKIQLEHFPQLFSTTPRRKGIDQSLVKSQTVQISMYGKYVAMNTIGEKNVYVLVSRSNPSQKCLQYNYKELLHRGSKITETQLNHL
jgi:hypothetical protein